MSTTFKKTVEDFVCGHCGLLVKGHGYTNHCPHCLWTKHIDVYPGDREAECNNLMEPITTEQKGGEWRIVHRCVQCGHESRNKVEEEDDRSALIALASRRVDREVH